MRLFILLLAFECLIPACGKDDSNKGENNDGGRNQRETESGSNPEQCTQCAGSLDVARGPKGDKGDKGDQGPKGDTGTAGKAGSKGEAGKDAVPLPVNQWFDSLTATYWSILPSQVWTADACGLYRFPSTSEMQEAIDHGIFIAAHAIGAEDDNAWTGDADSPGHVAILPGITGADFDTQSHGVFCVRK